MGEPWCVNCTTELISPWGREVGLMQSGWRMDAPAWSRGAGCGTNSISYVRSQGACTQLRGQPKAHVGSTGVGGPEKELVLRFTVALGFSSLRIFSIPSDASHDSVGAKLDS